MNVISDHKKKNKTYFPNFYGVRFLAALAIFIFHAFSLFREQWIDIHQSRFYSYVISKGQLGVNLFFILSGFLITYLVLERKSKEPMMDTLSFFKRRALRILPLYFSFVLLCYFVFPILPWGNAPIYDMSSFFTFSFNFEEILSGRKDHLNYLTPLWSIAVECQYYLLVGGILLFFSKRLLPAFSTLYIGMIIISVLFRYIYNSEPRIIYYHSFSVMSDFAIGGLLALGYYKKKLQQFIQTLSIKKRGVTYGVIVLLLLFQYQIFSPNLRWMERLVIGASLGYVLLDIILNFSTNHLLERSKWIKSGGKISYGFYVYHVFVLFTFTSVFNFFNLQSTPFFFLLYISLSLLVSLGIAWLSFFYFELPLQKYFRKFERIK